MAGYAPISLQQRVDKNGKPFPGAKAYFYAADSLLPITVYQDYSLGTAHPNPVQADAFGVFPPIFLDEEDEFYRIRITTASGVILTDLSTLPIIGPTGGSGGGSDTPVDPNALFKTGDVIWLDQSGSRAGWVRDNGRTIGSATSGASERANADCENLFSFLWSNYSDTICPVTGGRGATSAADWAANKPVGLPDKRGYVPGGLDDMGNTAASRYSGVPVISGSVTDAGSVIGETAHTLVMTETPSHTISGTTGNDSPDHTHGVTVYGANQVATSGGPTAAVNGFAGNTAGPNQRHQHPFSASNGGGDQSHNNVQRTVLGSFYRKL